jgi:hypothetical protein
VNCLPVNDSFYLPRKTQKVTSVTPTSILQYAEMIGNLPSRRKFGDRIPIFTSTERFGQAFTATKEKIKAVGVYLKVDFRAIGQQRAGKVMLKLYSWGTYPNTATLTEMTYPVSGRAAEVEIDINNIQDQNETIFEFEESIPVTLGNTYFFTVVQTEGFSSVQPLYIGSSAINYGSTLGDFWIWDTWVAANSRRMTPATDFLFTAYVSITELAVEIVGPGSGSLSGIQEALVVDETEPQAGFGLIDYVKPAQTHGQVVIVPLVGSTTWYGNALISPGAGKPAFSAAGDLNVPLSTVGAVSFVGSGLNDMTAGTTFTGLQDLFITVTIASIGPPDTFDWAARDADGNLIASATGVTITGAAQALTSGVTITFGAVGGHTLSDRWLFYVANWDFAIIRVADDRIRCDWGDASDTLDCSTSFRLLQEGDALIIPEYISQFSFRKHDAADTDPTISITLWRTIP